VRNNSSEDEECVVNDPHGLEEVLNDKLPSYASGSGVALPKQ
jgi:hypothetical protein